MSVVYPISPYQFWKAGMGDKSKMSTQKRFVVVAAVKSSCDYDFIDEFNSKAEAEAWIKSHQSEYEGCDLFVKEY